MPAGSPRSTSQSRKHRGYRTQRMVAEWFQRNGWPHAESTGAGRAGTDITGLVGVDDIEIKATSSFSNRGVLEQIRARLVDNSGEWPVYFAVHRVNGTGEATIADWPVITDLKTMTLLLKLAGFGDGSDGDR